MKNGHAALRWKPVSKGQLKYKSCFSPVSWKDATRMVSGQNSARVGYENHGITLQASTPHKSTASTELALRI